MADDDVQQAIALLRERGYYVSGVEPCRHSVSRPDGTPWLHGRHTLRHLAGPTYCAGSTPLPHGYHSSHQGTFDVWVACLCGRDFNSTNWPVHKAEHGICTCMRERHPETRAWSIVEKHNPDCTHPDALAAAAPVGPEETE